MPQANSTTSRPRAISPSASECTLPCSAVTSAASSSRRAASSSRNANITWVRRVSDVAAQPSAAALAAAITRAASASSAIATRPVTWPVAGLVTSPVRSLAPVHLAPSTQCGIVVSSTPAS